MSFADQIRRFASLPSPLGYTRPYESSRSMPADHQLELPLDIWNSLDAARPAAVVDGE